jgi:hypothetical protein
MESLCLFLVSTPKLIHTKVKLIVYLTNKMVNILIFLVFLNIEMLTKSHKLIQEILKFILMLKFGWKNFRHTGMMVAQYAKRKSLMEYLALVDLILT